MNRRLEQCSIGLCALLLISSSVLKAEKPEHAGTAVDPKRASAPQGPNDCEKVDEKNAARILEKGDRILGRLLLSTTLFSAKFAEARETPTAQALQRGIEPATEGDLFKKAVPASGVLSLGLILAGTANISGYSVANNNVLSNIRLNRGIGSIAAAGLLQISMSWAITRPGHSRLDEAKALAKGNEKELRRQISESLDEPTQFYTELLGWKPEQKQKFIERYLDRAITLVNTAPKPGIGVDVKEIDPLDVIEEIQPEQKNEIQALRDLRKLADKAYVTEQGDRPSDKVFFVPSAKKIQERILQLDRSSHAIEKMIGELPVGSRARSEGERLLKEVSASQKQLRELCKLASE